MSPALMRTSQTLVGVALGFGIACGSVSVPSPAASPSPVPAPTRPEQFLRVTNAGPSAAQQLIVQFPDRVRVAYGDIEVGRTTEHVPVPNGVFRYAAYSLEVSGEMVDQPVIDWVGERPMDGRSFTYVLEVDSTRQSRPWVRLVRVVRDE